MGELGEFPSSVEKLGARCQPSMIGRQLGILPSQSPNCSGSLVLTETKFVPDEIHQVRAIFPVVNRERGIKPWYGLRITFLAKRLASAVHQNAQPFARANWHSRIFGFFYFRALSCAPSVSV